MNKNFTNRKSYGKCNGHHGGHFLGDKYDLGKKIDLLRLQAAVDWIFLLILFFGVFTVS
jgi:hypothetical protein